MAQAEVSAHMMKEVPDQFVDYMVMNNIVQDFTNIAHDDEHPETLHNNYVNSTSIYNSSVLTSK